MSEIINEDVQRRREYHQEWRRKHQKSVIAAQLRYWMKKAEEAKRAEATTEIRSTTGGIENAQ